MPKKRDLHTLIDEDVFRVLEKHMEELGDQRSVIEKALADRPGRFDRRILINYPKPAPGGSSWRGP